MNFKEDLNKRTSKMKKYKEVLQKLTKSTNELKKKNENLVSIQTDLLVKLEKREEEFESYKETVKSLMSDNNVSKKGDKNLISFQKYEQVLNKFTQEEKNYKKTMEQLKEENEKMKLLLMQSSVSESILNTSNSSVSYNEMSTNILNRLNKLPHTRLNSQPDISTERISVNQGNNKSFNVNMNYNNINNNNSNIINNNINIDDTEKLLNNQINILKDELRNNKKELDNLKKDNKQREESMKVLQDYFLKFIENIELNIERKQYLGIIMKGLDFNDKQITERLSKGDKKRDSKFLGILKKK